MAGHPWGDWFEREEFIGQISDIRVQNLQVERELVQKRTFTRWMNLHLEKCDPPIEVHDLFQDIQDGRILMALLEELSGCRLLHGFKKSSHRIFRLNNIAKVLSFLEERNVKLVSIDAANVADGNSSIILGLIWNIILFFQIKELTGNIRSQFPSCSSLSSIPTSSDSDGSMCSTPSDERPSTAAIMREQSKAIKKLLQWAQKRTRRFGVTVNDFGKSWRSGLAFLAVIKSIDSTLVDMSKSFLRTARENLEDAFHIAHYSLGIPRLLEPEDVTISAPDEQSIITYVSQFLEHFPGVEETEEKYQPIERSVSIGRLNFYDGLHDTHGSTERSYKLQKDCRTKFPPKILISSLSEDKSVIASNSRVAPTRTWSSENISSRCSTWEFSKKPENLSSRSHPSSVFSEADSESSETVIDDSPVVSPDSYESSKFRGIPDSCESSSLADSGTGWDVYHAVPVEVTNVDQGFISPLEDRPPDDVSMTESCTDVGIYSLSSLESSQEAIHSDKNQLEDLSHSVTELLHQNVPDQNPADSADTVDYLHLGKNLAFRQEESSFDPWQEHGPPEPNVEFPVTCIDPPSPAEECAESNLENVRAITGPSDGIQLECNKSDLPLDTERAIIRDQSHIVELHHGFSNSQQNSFSETLRVEESSDMTNPPGASEACLDINIPLISISHASQELDDEGISDPDDCGTKSAPDFEIEKEEDVEDLSFISEGKSKHPVDDVVSCFEIEEVKVSSLEQKQEEINVDDDGKRSDTKEKTTRQHVSDLKDLIDSSPSTKTDSRLVCHGSTTDFVDQPPGRQSPTTSLSTDIPVLDTQQEVSHPACEESTKASPDTSPCPPPEQDAASVLEDLEGSPMEPMDLFYPDNEELASVEPRDTEMLSWPSVLCVSALLPAPASPSAPHAHAFLLPDHTAQQDHLMQDCHDEVRSSEPADASEWQEHGWSTQSPFREAITEPVRRDGVWPNGAEDTPPVIRHRKARRSAEAMDKSNHGSKTDHIADLDCWCSDSWELYVLLLLWLLLYCSWMLPQMDLTTLPSQLLNLDH